MGLSAWVGNRQGNATRLSDNDERRECCGLGILSDLPVSGLACQCRQLKRLFGIRCGVGNGWRPGRQALEEVHSIPLTAHNTPAGGHHRPLFHDDRGEVNLQEGNTAGQTAAGASGNGPRIPGFTRLGQRDFRNEGSSSTPAAVTCRTGSRSGEPKCRSLGRRRTPAGRPCRTGGNSSAADRAG